MKHLDRFDWKAIEAALDREGQAVLPGLLSGAEYDAKKLCAGLHEKLVPIANRWNETMGIRARYQDQHTLQSAVIRLRTGEHQPLKHNAEGEYVFPLQVSVLLNQPGRDFTGGELVMTEQRPRMQTRPMVVPLQRGDAVVFAVHLRPFKGSKGFYRVNLRHAVGLVRSGERVALDLVFHHAP